MTTNNQIDVGLSGSTGTGTFVGSTSPTLVTPTIGAATATNLTFNPTTNGIIGTTTNNNASSGFVGEYVSNQILFANAISVTNVTETDITSINLSAGDWTVYGTVFVEYSVGAGDYIGWINTASATITNDSQNSLLSLTAGTIAEYGGSIKSLRVSLASPGTAYLSVYVDSAGSATACGMIWARRER